jgi:enoyl-CoA hydratase/carnithine racemase
VSVVVEHHDRWLHLVIDRPQARNALNNATLQALLDALGAARNHTDLRSIVVSGAGGLAFSAGIDLVERRSLDFEGMGRQSRLVLEVIRSFVFCPVPIIASIRGWCLGGGLVHEVVERAAFDDAIHAKVAELQMLAPDAVSAVKESLRRSITLPLEEAFEVDQELRRPLDRSDAHHKLLQASLQVPPR